MDISTNMHEFRFRLDWIDWFGLDSEIREEDRSVTRRVRVIARPTTECHIQFLIN